MSKILINVFSNPGAEDARLIISFATFPNLVTWWQHVRRWDCLITTWDSLISSLCRYGSTRSISIQNGRRNAIKETIRQAFFPLHDSGDRWNTLLWIWCQKREKNLAMEGMKAIVTIWFCYLVPDLTTKKIRPPWDYKILHLHGIEFFSN